MRVEGNAQAVGKLVSVVSRESLVGVGGSEGKPWGVGVVRGSLGG